MNPKPFSALNHFTVPSDTLFSFEGALPARHFDEIGAACGPCPHPPNLAGRSAKEKTRCQTTSAGASRTENVRGTATATRVDYPVSRAMTNALRYWIEATDRGAAAAIATRAYRATWRRGHVRRDQVRPRPHQEARRRADQELRPQNRSGADQAERRRD